MACLRCGYCCFRYCVVIVDDPDKGFCEENLTLHTGTSGTPCKHLVGNSPGEFSCALHDKPFYKDTPCYQHNLDVSRCLLGEAFTTGKFKDTWEDIYFLGLDQEG